MRRGFRTIAVAALGSLAVAGGAAAAPGDQYAVRNLVTSDQTRAPAERVDANMVNPWGLTSSATSPWWTANNATDTSTLYNAANTPIPLVVGVTGGPTGLVFAGIAGAFPIPGGQSSFIFDTESGSLQAWRAGGLAVVAATHPGAIYKGLTLATTATGPQLYAADFHNGRVDVIDSQWGFVTAPGAFADPSLPAGYAPFGIQTIGNRIFVGFAEQDEDAKDEVAGTGKGYVDAFDTAGNLLARVASAGELSAPWGLAMAPANWGAFSGDLLVGNFGDGRINAFKETAPGSWAPDGTLQSVFGGPLQIGGLWALEFGQGGQNGTPASLYFTAGPFDEDVGLFGRITPATATTTPVSSTVPATLSLTLGPAGTFAPFLPGVGHDYLTSMTATVISTAGDATLSVADPSANATGRLVNGTFSLAHALQAQASSPKGTGGGYQAVGGSATPTSLLTYGDPVSLDPVTVGFKQSIGDKEPLRTGTYSKTLTFTLSTTTP